MNIRSPLAALGGAAGSLFCAAAALRAALYRQGWIPQRRLRAKVISIGNITWGGTGKTPFTIWLADRLTASGLGVSILSRGYRRASRAAVRILSAGTAPAGAAHDGDEVQLYLRHLRNVPVGIASSRFDAAHQLEKQFPVDAHLLDDGFQHLALARDVDLVLVDATNPWGARDGYSRLLRESPRALRRASAIILTHCEALDANAGQAKLESLRTVLRKLNPAAPQFLAATRLLGFVDAGGRNTCTPEQMRPLRTAAYCGVGAPQHFLSMLERAGIECVAKKTFPDHTRHGLEELQQIERWARENGANCLLTTEKDLVNLPPRAALELPLYWAEIAIEVEPEERLLQWLGETLGISLTGGDGVSEQKAPAGRLS